ncbi:MAG: diaminopimelate decarboxylase [Desulfarculaceae bacterium]|nr:diaminopimelate decarboxylase [Desulfarculaceae bacterium]MCF8073461.1 diaminopimelate decarboxylase [Desulfarculaceae bacterium]MCF8100392.1 diaminopimelate decarboxylase [Desulfarculaceae bacterium]MCF8115872.1 diaminopimelate decarboxylase [Desulfarculaceae bacterium]
MHHFSYKHGQLHAEDVPLSQIAEQVGTPTYVYSQATLERHYRAFSEAFGGLDTLICFAVKANSNRAVINTLAAQGAGADIVSGGELTRSLAAGVPAERIVYSGVGKTVAEMEQALDAGILMFNLESAQELEVLNQVAGRLGVKAPVSLRVNPDVDAQTHPKITTGLAKNKFGLDMELAFGKYQEAAKLDHVELKGISCHIGSQLTKVEPFADALERVAVLIGRLKGAGIELSLLDLGGGLGINYNDEQPPSPAQYAEALTERIGSLGLKLVLEPGRAIVGNAGVLVAKVLFTKDTPAKHFIVSDAAMNDLVRPAMYDSFHAILPVMEDPSRPKVVADVVGPICETGDFLARDREMPDLERGEFLAALSAGAYGFSMASTYNSRPRAAEVLVNGDRWSVVRTRETVEELMRGESLPEWME